MKVPLAWRNTFQNRKRTAAAVAGITFSVTLIFMQLGFLKTARITSTLLYDYFDYDIILVSSEYRTFLESAGHIDKTRLIQAAVDPGVAAVASLNVSRGSWTDPATEASCILMLIGTDLNPAFVRRPEIRDQLGTLANPNTAMLDRLSHPEFGPKTVGRSGLVNGTEVKVTSLFNLGMGFAAEGSVLTSNESFYGLARESARQVSFGLVKLRPGARVDEVIASLRSSLPADVLVFRRDALIRQEQEYFISVKPVGIMFRAGVFVAFLVGAVILFQVLATEISNKLKEFATLKAMGYRDTYVYKVGFQQAILYAVMSYVPALLISWGIYTVGRWVSRLPMYLDAGLIGFVLLLTAAMCVVSGALALRKVRYADPADLF